MSDSPSLAVRPEVSDFVARVRARLGDLTEEEREELVGGLEADLSERLEDVGPGGLGDPVAYAAELRAAAGLDVPGRRVRTRVANPGAAGPRGGGRGAGRCAAAVGRAGVRP